MISKLRRLPILLLLVMGISALFLAFTYDHQKKVLKDTYGLIVKDNEAALETYIKLGSELGSKALFDELNSALEEARNAHKIDFYILQYQGHALWFGEKSGNLDRIDIQYPIANDLMVTNEISFRSEMIGDGYQLTLGVEKDFDAYFQQHRRRFIESMLQEMIYTFLIVIVVAFYSLRDIMLMVREVKRGKKGQLAAIKSNSAESELFKKGLSGYAQAVADLEAENVRLGRQVLPSLQKEIHSGRKPPYDFECTMVRTDINHFSTIFNTHNVTEFMATINEFFDEVSRIVARYGGLIHEFVGDEVIYYFKDEEHANSFAVALSAVRDVNDLAARFHRSTMAARGYPFTVKSSLAHGKVRFGPLVSGFTVAGAVLIETVRILGHIVEKDENVVYFDGINVARIDGFIATIDRLRVKMKGYQSEIALHQYVSHEPLSRVLQTLTPETVERLGCYRSDPALKQIIEDLRDGATLRPLETTLMAIRVLRDAHIARAEEKLGPPLRDWIYDLADHFANETFDGSGKVLSAVVKLYINLVPHEDFTPDDREALTALLSSEDRRVVANTVEVLTHFSASAEGAGLPPVSAIRRDLRIAANSLVHDGREDLSPHVVKSLRALLKSKRPNEIASGLYAVGELAFLHRTRDFAYYSAQVDFQNLVDQLDTFAQHTTTMVRRQALIAARKAAHEGVINKIRHHVQDSGSELLAEELRRYLDTYNSSAA
jgi:adenylate cyclase